MVEAQPEIVKPAHLQHPNASIVYGDRSPDLIKERDDIEIYVDEVGGRETIWEWQKCNNLDYICYGSGTYDFA